ncbi:hypothetical protein VN97_g8989 [Penicillium thymicola]|uniref:DUF7136 domain-containing protein n=1 Tax=Penicillium thymicola TaxID=293382 RepID=A0AAI9TCA7_PENTH|nr:hypothetical protein VN97_g8989 [Penicillium thymicola]
MSRLTVVDRGVPPQELGFADPVFGSNGVAFVAGRHLVEAVAVVDDARHGGLICGGRRGGSGGGGLGLPSDRTDHTVKLAGVEVRAADARVHGLQVVDRETPTARKAVALITTGRTGGEAAIDGASRQRPGRGDGRNESSDKKLGKCMLPPYHAFFPSEQLDARHLPGGHDGARIRRARDGPPLPPQQDLCATEWFPVVFGVQNPELAPLVDLDISFTIRNANNMSDIVHWPTEIDWTNNTSKDPYFFYAYFSEFRTPGRWRVAWNVHWKSCNEFALFNTSMFPRAEMITNSTGWSTWLTIEETGRQPTSSQTRRETPAPTNSPSPSPSLTTPSGSPRAKNGPTAATVRWWILRPRRCSRLIPVASMSARPWSRAWMPRGKRDCARARILPMTAL